MKTLTHRYWKYGAIILGIGFLGASLENRKTKKTLDGIYRYNVEVTVLDATTDQPLDRISIKAPSKSTADLFQHTTGISGGADGIVGVSGIAYEPRTWNFGRAGYKSASITVNEDTQPSLTIKLEPIQAAEAGSGQPATLSGVESEDSDKSQPEAEGRSR